MNCHIVLVNTGERRCSVCFSAPGEREKCVGPIESELSSRTGLRDLATAAVSSVGITKEPGEAVVIGGPGTELHGLLRDWLKIEPTHGCQCESMAAKMDKMGSEWCLSDDGLAEILGVMRDEHAKRWADGRTILPWTDAGARQLVLLACRRASAKSN